MSHFLKVVFAALVISSLYYYLDNSVERVQDATMKDLAYVILGDNRNPAYKEQQEERLDIMLEKMEGEGFRINEGLLDALEDNSYIHDIKWTIISHGNRGRDEVFLNFKLIDNKLEIPVKATFFVKPKPSPSMFLSDPDISRLSPMLVVEMSYKGKTVKYVDTKRIDGNAYITFIVFYDEGATRSMFKRLTH